MAGKHIDVLAAQIFNEQNIVTYRLLSRLLGVHVNLAKQMLAEFYQQAKREGKSCHATYILSGLMEESISQSANDEMQVDTGDDFPLSSPVLATQESSRSTNPTTKLVRTVVLADEKEVHEVKERFAELTSIHVYSLAPAAVADPVLLTTCSYDVSKNYDNVLLPLEAAQKYGIIANPNAIKRELKKHAAPPVSIATAASKAKPVGTKPSVVKTEVPPEIKSTEANPPSAEFQGPSESTKPPTKATTTAKRTASGSIMSAFANAPPKSSKPKLKQEEKEEKPTVAPAAVAEIAPRISAKRQQELDEVSKMMEDDEPALEDFPEAPSTVEDSQDTPMTIDSPATTDVPAPEEQQPKRKRGKRKVLKKTTKRDEKGYLVTKNEYVYESFSEDEDSDAQVEKKPTSSAPKPASAATTKGKKDAAGQKSLMSFFGKK